MRANLDEQTVISANAQFWEQMLSINLEPVPMAEIFCVGTRHLLGTVELSGMWTGRIEVRIDEKLALCATAAMLMQPLETVGPADTLDATKEITNMIAGVIKSSLPRPCTMTVPISVEQAEGRCELQRSDSALAVGFRHAGRRPDGPRLGTRIGSLERASSAKVPPSHCVHSQSMYNACGQEPMGNRTLIHSPLLAVVEGCGS